MGQGEPLNMIISGNSDAEVLVDSEMDGGLRNYFLCVSLFEFRGYLGDSGDNVLFHRSLGFAGECLGQHSGSNQGANLGDGNGSSKST